MTTNYEGSSNSKSWIRNYGWGGVGYEHRSDTVSSPPRLSHDNWIRKVVAEESSYDPGAVGLQADITAQMERALAKKLDEEIVTGKKTCQHSIRVEDENGIELTRRKVIRGDVNIRVETRRNRKNPRVIHDSSRQVVEAIADYLWNTDTRGSLRGIGGNVLWVVIKEMIEQGMVVDLPEPEPANRSGGYEVRVEGPHSFVDMVELPKKKKPKVMKVRKPDGSNAATPDPDVHG